MPIDLEEDTEQGRSGWRPAWWALGCFFVCALLINFGLQCLHDRGFASSRRVTDRVFQLAAQANYDQLAREHLVDDQALRTLKLLDQQHGRIQAYSPAGADTKLLGRPSWTRMFVTRNGKQYVDDLALIDSSHVQILMEYPKEDYDRADFSHGLRAQ